VSARPLHLKTVVTTASEACDVRHMSDWMAPVVGDHIRTRAACRPHDRQSLGWTRKEWPHGGSVPALALTILDYPDVKARSQGGLLALKDTERRMGEWEGVRV